MIAKFLSLFLSYVILLTSLPITNNAYAAITKEQCEDMPGKQWNERTGRCVEAQDITRLSGDAMACADSADPNCYTGNAIEQIGESDAPDSRGGSRNNLGRSQIRQVLPMAMSLFTTLYMLKNRSTGTENPKWKNARTISLSLILASGYAIAIGEISAHITYKMKLKKLVKNYKRDLETNVDDDTTDTDTVTTSTSEEDENGLSLIERRQKEAYTFLAKQEDLRKKAANIRRAFYITATAMYTAASIAAIMETIQENTTGANNTETPAGGGGASSSGSSPTSFLYTPKQDSRFVNLQKNFIDYSLEKELNGIVTKPNGVNWNELAENEWMDIILKMASNMIMPSAHAEDYLEADDNANVKPLEIVLSFSTLVLGTALVALVAIKPVQESIDKVLDKTLGPAPGRIVIGALLAGYSGAMAGVNGKDARVADDRAREIRKIRDRFLLNSSIDTDRCESRDDMTKPLCYCYLASGEQNQQRRASNTCKIAWGKVPTLRPDSYDPQDYAGNDSPVCATASTVDVNCGCRQTNTCHRVQANFSLPSLGGSSFINEPANALNSLYNGNTSAGSLDSRNLENMAMRMKKNKDKILAHPKFAKIAKQAKDGEAQLRTKLEGDMVKAFSTPQGQSALASMSPAGGDAGVSTPKPEEVLAKAKDALLPTANIAGGGSDKKQEDLFNLDLGGNTGNAINIDDEMAKTMEQDYEIKGDIHSNSSHNIFNILTLRYQRSALPRFFDKEKKVELDKGSKSDITGK